MQSIDLEKARNHKPIKKETGEVKHATEAMGDFVRLLDKDPTRIEGVPTKYWQTFNKCFGGLRPELIVITAETGNGKSTFARNWFQDCIHQNIASCMFTLEEGILSVMHRFSQMELGKKSHTLTRDDKSKLGASLENFPFYYVDWKGMMSEEVLINTLHYCVDEKQIKFFIIDHLDYIIKAPTWSNNESYVIGDFLRKLASISHDKEVTIVLVVHPSKLSVAGDKRREVGIDDMKGSSSIKQEADAVFSLFRESKGNQNSTLKFLKIRSHLYSKFQYTKINYEFDEYYLRFNEIGFDGGLDE